jgi:hypothetical protein
VRRQSCPQDGGIDGTGRKGIRFLQNHPWKIWMEERFQIQQDWVLTRRDQVLQVEIGRLQ